jgi:hypothetical protein
MCICGHPFDKHTKRTKGCSKIIIENGLKVMCRCSKFIEDEEWA